MTVEAQTELSVRDSFLQIGDFVVNEEMVMHVHGPRSSVLYQVSSHWSADSLVFAQPLELKDIRTKEEEETGRKRLTGAEFYLPDKGMGIEILALAAIDAERFSLNDDDYATYILDIFAIRFLHPHVNCLHRLASEMNKHWKPAADTQNKVVSPQHVLETTGIDT